MGTYKIIINAMNISAISISMCGLIIDDIDAVASQLHLRKKAVFSKFDYLNASFILFDGWFCGDNNEIQ